MLSGGDLNMLSSGDAYKFLRHGSLEVPRKFRNVVWLNEPGR